jgi:hypothetical protein
VELPDGSAQRARGVTDNNVRVLGIITRDFMMVQFQRLVHWDGGVRLRGGDSVTEPELN